jgi:OOP family OmpA-OmpF porin
MKGATGKVISGLIAAAAVALSPSAFAQEQGSKVYLGGAYGSTKIGGSCDDARSAFALFVNSAVTSCDEKDTGWKIFGGVQINKNFAIEASYIDWGQLSGSGRLVGIPVSISGDATSFGVAAVGILPLNDRFSVFGKAGILMTTLKATIAGGGVSASDSEDNTELHLGVGAMFHITERWAVRGEWERAQDSKLDMLSIGIQYRF